VKWLQAKREERKLEDLPAELEFTLAKFMEVWEEIRIVKETNDQYELDTFISNLYLWIQRRFKFKNA
jgi:hypothetical protein